MVPKSKPDVGDAEGEVIAEATPAENNHSTLPKTKQRKKVL